MKIKYKILIVYGVLPIIYLGNSLINSIVNLEYLYIFLEIFLSYFFIGNTFSKVKLKEKYAIVYIILFLNMLFSFMELFNIFNMKLLILEINKWEVLNKNNFSPFRNVGLFSGYDLNSIFLSNFILFNVFIFKKNKTIRFILALISLILIISAARIGIIYTIIIAFFFSRFFKILKFNKCKKMAFDNILIFLILIISIYLMYTNFQEITVKIFSRTFEMITNYFVNRTIRTDSTDELLKMYIYPQEMIKLIFGDGKLNSARFSQKGYSDVGYIQLLWTYGILGMSYVMYLYLYNYFLIFRLKLGSESSKIIKKLLLGTILAILVISFKGPYFLSIPIINYCFMICFIFREEKEKSKIDKRNISNYS